MLVFLISLLRKPWPFLSYYDTENPSGMKKTFLQDGWISP
ncbi:2,3-bisphosphoglycerate-dependent phosphoglycerate mutase domain protein [Chlamydia psittaci C1/97]|nr:2,3-bisphosphoglycerate-dependent phosphoglycerate mutase domain protein [Chlamydia psittaci C1/97]